MGYDAVILGIVLGTLAAIVYSLRVLVLMERRIARIDNHIESLVMKIYEEEKKIEAEQLHLEKMLRERSSRGKPVKRVKKPKK